MKPPFLDAIHEEIILGDGALGTYLYEKGVGLGTNTEFLNIIDPDLIFSVHEEYVRAGSRLIETNTFGANRLKLGNVGQASKVRQINLEGVALAAKAAGGEIYVAGSVGPSGVDMPMEADLNSTGEIREIFKEQISALLEGGVDLLILETFSSLDELLEALSVTRSLDRTIPVVAQMSYPSGGRTALGISAVDCARAALENGADIIGTNCGRGVKAMLPAIELLSAFRDQAPICAFPNAGIPEVIDHRTVYTTPTTYMASKVGEMVKQGVRLVGGCCGTTPAHIYEFRQHLHIRRPAALYNIRTETGEPDQRRPHVSTSGMGGLLESFDEDRLPVLVELDPPKHLDITNVLAGAAALKEAGADAITLAENPLAALRADNLSIAHLIRQGIGIQTILHLTCRDRNVLGLQAQIMGAHLLGIEGILAVTGDPATSSDQPGVSGVFDVNSYGLVKMISRFNQGFNMAGMSMRARTNFSVGVAFSFRPKNPDLQLRRLERKASLGAHFVMTQPIFDSGTVEDMVRLTENTGLMVFPGIFPLISARNAEFLHHEVPGISIPEGVRKTLWKYAEVEDQRKAALVLTLRLLEEIAQFVDGLYLISPLNKWDVPVKLLEAIRSAGWMGSGRIRSLTAGD